jgi:AcrR family transcriptional regulator
MSRREDGVVETGSRRDRLRAATAREIKQVARTLLVEQGAEAVTLRAIARTMGMTAPALYRYFDSHDELLRHVVTDMYTELTGAVRAAVDAADPGDTMNKLAAASHAFRRWALDHRTEYALLFGTPPGLRGVQADVVAECSGTLGRVFLDLFVELWQRGGFPVPDERDIDPALRPQLERFAAEVDTPLPLGALQVYLSCWLALYGSVSIEVFGHMRFALDDAAPMFDLVLADLGRRLGL